MEAMLFAEGEYEGKKFKIAIPARNFIWWTSQEKDPEPRPEPEPGWPGPESYRRIGSGANYIVMTCADPGLDMETQFDATDDKAFFFRHEVEEIRDALTEYLEATE